METTDLGVGVTPPLAAGKTEGFADRLPRAAKIALAVLGIVAFLALYLLATKEQAAQQNQDRLKHDQSAMLHFSERLASYGAQYARVAPRNRMPLYPFFQTLAYRKGMSDDDFFAAGKQANVWLSVILLVGIFAVFRASFPLHATINVLLITAFGVFALKAPYIQAEVLFYFWTLLYFLLMVRMLRRPGWLPALGLGVVLAVAHMTKASTLPAIALFVFFFAIKCFRQKWFANAGEGRRGNSWLRPLYGVLAVGLFLALIFPYLQYSKQRYHSYFYNVNSTFYMWCDTWVEAKNFSDAYDDRHFNPNYDNRLANTDPAADDVPSFAKYRATHSIGKILGRFIHGLGRMVTETFRSVWYMPYVLAFVAGAAFAVWRSWPKVLAALRVDPVTPAFIACFFLSYIALYSWWMILARSQRFVLTLFLPLLFVLTYVCQTYGKHAQIRITGKQLAFSTVMDWLGIALALINVPVVLFWAAKAVNGGSTM